MRKFSGQPALVKQRLSIIVSLFERLAAKNKAKLKAAKLSSTVTHSKYCSFMSISKLSSVSDSGHQVNLLFQLHPSGKGTSSVPKTTIYSSSFLISITKQPLNQWNKPSTEHLSISLHVFIIMYMSVNPFSQKENKNTLAFLDQKVDGVFPLYFNSRDLSALQKPSALMLI